MAIMITMVMNSNDIRVIIISQRPTDALSCEVENVPGVDGIRYDTDK